MLYSTSSSVLTHLKNSLTRHNSTVWFRLMEVSINCVLACFIHRPFVCKTKDLKNFNNISIGK